MKQEKTTMQPKEGLHTHGTWWIDRASNDSELIITAGVGTIAIASLYCQPMDEETKANAELICKAVNERKALLDALEKLYSAAGRHFAFPNREAIREEFTVAYLNADTIINNAKNI